MAMFDSAPPTNTLREFMQHLSPNRTIDDWFTWPPDIFALCGLLLKSTGAYRFAVEPPEVWPVDENWAKTVEEQAKEWHLWIWGEREKPPQLLLGHIVAIEHHGETSVDSLVALSPPAAWSLCRVLLELFALSDQACRGFGLHSAIYGRSHQTLMASRYFANMLLATTGSLSRLPASRVLILPKLRTPQVGLTLRSLSHHVSLQQSEVEVVWRSIPWINSEENTINIMVVPWPREIHAASFRPENRTLNRKSPEPARYFSYSISADETSARNVVDDVVAMIKVAKNSVSKVHIVAFPELALDGRQLEELKARLANDLKGAHHIPILITGVSTAAKEGIVDTPDDLLGKNQVILSVFFAGKWYDLKQDKHHRWRLDGDQIWRYNLGGVLAANQFWWEAVAIPRRRITFLAPTSWLTLCPLICEDLARLEPVSELIRGVGPTLLISILLDGPQLKQRWSGRYASVLADDPGTSVLTVSSLGMALRSRSGSATELNSTLDGDSAVTGSACAVALWKDGLTGWKEIKMGPQDGAVILSVSAGMATEFTADGRGDQCNASAFALQGTHIVRLPVKEPAGPPMANKESQPVEYATASAIDALELTAFSYLVDVALDSCDEFANGFCDLLLGRIDTPFFDKGLPQGELGKIIVSALAQRYELEPPEEGILEKHQEFACLVNTLREIIKGVRQQTDNPDSKTIVYWAKLAEEARRILDEADRLAYGPTDETTARKLRVDGYAALSILWAVHKRVADVRGDGRLNSDTARLLWSIEQEWPQRSNKEWLRKVNLELSQNP